MMTQNTISRSRCLPHLDQARTWYRYARSLRDRPFNARRKRKEALTYSLYLRSRTFILPSRLQPTPEAAQGLRRLERFVEEGGVRFMELAARIVQVDDDDPTADEVHLFLEEPDRTSSRNRRYQVGKLPQEDACWVVPLLRLETDACGTGPILGFFAQHGTMGCNVRDGNSPATSEFPIVIAHAHEAARQWFDWKEERAARYDAFYRVCFYDERAYAMPW